MPRKNEILNLCAHLRAEGVVRADYEELLDLVELYLSDEPSPVRIQRPGALHKARFMGKLLYAIKMDFLTDKILQEFPPGTVYGKSKNRQELKLRRFVKFAIFCYISWWFTSPVPAYAPSNDLEFLKNLERYRTYDEPLVNAALEKFGRHTWYLSQELVPLSLFCRSVPIEDKKKMATKLLSIARRGNETSRTGEGFGRPLLPIIPPSVIDVDLSSFIGADSWLFFDITSISPAFLHKPVEEWTNDPSWVRGKSIVDAFSVVNDAAERGVKLTADFLSAAKKEEVFQNVLQVVENSRKLKPNQRKLGQSE